MAYSAKNFAVHNGVKSIFSHCQALLECTPPRPIFIYGGPRSGKSHFAVALADRLCGVGMRPVLLDAVQFEKLAKDGIKSLLEREVFIVDDVNHYLSTLTPGSSGPFVTLLERLRNEGVGLIVISGQRPDEFPCDGHVLSRVRAMAYFELGAPEESQLEVILDSMAKQRGMALGGRRLKFLQKRVSRSIAEVEEYLARVQHLSQIVGKRVGYRLLGDALRTSR